MAVNRDPMQGNMDDYPLPKFTNTDNSPITFFNSGQAPQPQAQPQAQPNPTAQQNNPNVMKQGATYEPVNGGTSSNGDVGDSDGNSGGKKVFKLNPKLVLGIGGIVVLTAVVFMIFSGPRTQQQAEETTTEFIDPFDNPGVVWDEPDGTLFYSQEDVIALREAGYTGWEIEQYGIEQRSADELIEEAKVLRDAWVQEAVAPLYDMSSDAYKEMVSQTWLSLRKRADVNEWEDIAGYYQVRANLDYEKVDVYGNQLFVKIYLSDNNHDDFFFVFVTPEDYNKLKDSGNVIVNYTYVTRYLHPDEYTSVEDTRNIFIISASLEII